MKRVGSFIIWTILVFWGISYMPGLGGHPLEVERLYAQNQVLGPKQPDVQQPDVVQPDVQQPDVQQPDVLQPEVQKSEPIKPEHIKPIPIKPRPIRPIPVTPTPVTPTPLERINEKSALTKSHFGDFSNPSNTRIIRRSGKVTLDSSKRRKSYKATLSQGDTTKLTVTYDEIWIRKDAKDTAVSTLYWKKNEIQAATVERRGQIQNIYSRTYVLDFLRASQ